MITIKHTFLLIAVVTTAFLSTALVGSSAFYAQTCFVVKTDSDSDTNDDYVDEYEWGVNAPQPIRVESVCNARFKNQQFTGNVQAGPTCFQVG